MHWLGLKRHSLWLELWLVKPESPKFRREHPEMRMLRAAAAHKREQRSADLGIRLKFAIAGFIANSQGDGQDEALKQCQESVKSVC